jgi:hypothetical protein
MAQGITVIAHFQRNLLKRRGCVLENMAAVSGDPQWHDQFVATAVRYGKSSRRGPAPSVQVVQPVRHASSLEFASTPDAPGEPCNGLNPALPIASNFRAKPASGSAAVSSVDTEHRVGCCQVPRGRANHGVALRSVPALISGRRLAADGLCAR